MSIRIHKLAEELGLDNKEMLALLKERKIIAADVKSVSSTVDNINAAVLREEFAERKAAAPVAEPAPAPLAPEATPAPKVSQPSGPFVKSKQDIEREKEAAAAAKLAAQKAAAAAAAAPVSAPPAPPAAAPKAPLDRKTHV